LIKLWQFENWEIVTRGTYGKKWTVMEEKFNFPILMQNKNIDQKMKKLIFDKRHPAN